MNRYVFIALSLVLQTPLCFSQPSSRVEIEQRIVYDYMQAQAGAYSVNSPVIENFVRPAKAANPGVPEETWQKVRPDIASAIVKVMTGPESPTGVALKSSFQELSIEELGRLRTLLEDPVYLKFQTSMSSQSVQRQVAQATATLTLRMIGALNGVLASHGLKEVH